MPVQDLSLLLADKISNRKIFSKFKKIKDFYHKSIEERQKIVHERLARTLKNAYESIPFYYDLAESNELREVFLNFDNNLDQIPTIDKKTLIDNKRFFLKPETTEKITYCSTNGSTGGRVTIAYDQNAIDWSAAVTLFCRNCYSHKLNNKEVHVATDTRSLDFKSQAKQLMKEFANKRFNLFVKDFSVSSVKRYLEILKNQKTNLLHGMPSQISGLVDSSSNGFHIPLIETSGEILRAAQRERIESFFSTNVVDRYGLAEAGIVAYQMPEQEYLSIIDFHTFVEVDSSGEIIITNLNNDIMPLIRYRTGDFCSTKESSDEGLKIQLKEGREHIVATYTGEKVNTGNIEDIIFKTNGVLDLQFQVSEKKELINIIVNLDNHESLEKLCESVNSFFNLDLGKIIKVGNRNDFKMSGTQAKQLRVVIAN